MFKILATSIGNRSLELKLSSLNDVANFVEFIQGQDCSVEISCPKFVSVYWRSERWATSFDTHKKIGFSDEQLPLAQKLIDLLAKRDKRNKKIAQLEREYPTKQTPSKTFA